MALYRRIFGKRQAKAAAARTKTTGLDPERNRNIDWVVEALLTLVPSGRPQVTQAVTRGAARLLVALGHAPVAEVGLPNGRRADLMALGPRGEILIVEVKSSPEDYLCDRKWGDYLPYCDSFYFAVGPEFPQALLPEEPGLIVADGFGGAVLRDAPASRLAPARRKALILAFGRLAAMRSLGT